jgi:sulfite oxidase
MGLASSTSRRQFLKSTAAIAAAGGLASPHFVFGWQHQASAAAELLVRTPDPFNAEPALAKLIASAITPIKHFYVRNHGPTPKIDAAGFKVRIEGLVHHPAEFSVAEIKQQFRQRTIEATLTCAGNRRQEMNAIKAVGGVQWDAGAIGHARWTGVSLFDLLNMAGLKPEAKHVWFEGLDPIKEKDGSVAPFGGSIPLERVLASGATVLVAHAMNDEPLSAEHGFPLRTIVPGYIGARSVKWLAKITLSDRPSPNHYVANAYKLIQSEAKDEVAAAEPIYGFPVNAAICLPAAGAKVRAGRNVIAGYALPSGDRPCRVAKIELSRDGGRTWSGVSLGPVAATLCWQPWSTELELPPGKHELVVRATDTIGNTMPERSDWNFKGYLYNGWHRVSIEAT